MSGLDLASCARAELDGREREAGWDPSDLAAWRTIAGLLGVGEGVDAVDDWAALAAAARSAEARRWARWPSAETDLQRQALGLRIAQLSGLRHRLELRAILAGQLTAAQCGPATVEPLAIAA